MTETEALILRGQSILMRAAFSPNEPIAQAKHFTQLQADIGPWFGAYATLMQRELSPAAVDPGQKID